MRDFLEWPFFDDGHKKLATELDAWASKELASLAKDEPSHDEVHAFCEKVREKLAKGKWLEYAVPKAYGGRFEGFDVRSLCIIRETLARHLGLADFVFALQGLGSGAISLFGSEELKKEYLPAVASGKKVAAFALTEPSTGSDPANLLMTATGKGDHYVLDGEKTFISNGGIADFYTVFARTGEGEGAKGISAFVVDTNTNGLEIGERIDMIAPHPLSQIAFKNCKVPKTHLLRSPGEGFKIAMATLDIFRVSVGAAALGFARHALELASQRTIERKMFGSQMANLQMVQAMIADMVLDIDASTLLVYRAGWQQDVLKTPVTKEAAMAKLFATEAAQRVVDKAVQIWGGMGVVSGHPVEKLYREVRALRIYEGASEVQKIIIARKHLKGMK